MEHDILTSLSRMADTDLLARVKALITGERGLTAEVVAHLAELDTRDVHLREGYPSLYIYCRDRLGLSEWEAYNRIEVARAARRFPLILQRLADGSVNLTAVRLLAPHLTPDNHRVVLESARGKRKPEIQDIVVRLSPRPDVPASVRQLPTPQPECAISMLEMAHVALPRADETVGGAGIPTAVAAAPPGRHIDAECGAARRSPAGPASVAPLSPDRYKLQLTISGETLEKLRLAKDMLGHCVPSGDDAVVLDRALDALLADLARKKFAGTKAPRPSKGRKPGARCPSAAVRRTVWLRDLGRCAFVGKGGHRCDERRFVEFHHVDPYALGGQASVDGIQLRCRRHNDYEGRLYFGERRPGRREDPRRRELVLEQVRLSTSRSTSMGEMPEPTLKHDA
jgi:hypothetical protein